MTNPKPWEESLILRDRNDAPIPQLWDDDAKRFVPYEGKVSFKGTQASEPFSGDFNKTHTFSKTMSGFVISNDGDSDLTFIIHFESYLVKAGEVFDSNFPAFQEVEIITSVPYRAYGRA